MQKTIQPNDKTALMPIFLFSLVIFYISLNDGIMSYIVPIIVDANLADSFKTGLIISISSTFGMFFDIFAGKNFGRKTYAFFVFWMLTIATLFPSFFLFLPHNIFVFAMAMIVWSAYYELRNYAKYDFVHRYVTLEQHTTAWSILTPFQAAAYAIGPALAVSLINSKNSYAFPLYTALSAILISITVYFIFQKTFGKKSANRTSHTEGESLFKELKVMKILVKRVWPVVIFSFAVTLIDVVYWTVGVLYAEKLREINPMGGFLLTIYCLPTIFVGFITPFIHKKLGKKKTAYILGTIAGICLTIMGMSKNIWYISVFTFFVAVLSGVIVVLVSAIFEDYVARLSKLGNDMVSVYQFTNNFAYALGPALLGLIAKIYGSQQAFISIGIILFLVSIISWVISPRKIKMPQRELAEADIGIDK